MSGLRRRFSFSFLLVAFTVVTVTVGLILVAGSQLFANYLSAAQLSRHQRLIWALERSYAAVGGWEDLQFFGFGGYMGMMAGAGFLVRDAGGRVVLAYGSYGQSAGEPHPEEGSPSPPGWGGRGMRRGGMMWPGRFGWENRGTMPMMEQWRNPLRLTRREATYPLIVDGRRIGTVTFELPRAAALGTLEARFRQLVLLAALAAALLAAAIGWVAGDWLARRLTQPILELRDATRQFAAGQLGARVRRQAGDETPDEIEELAQSFNLMAERLERLEQVRRQLTADVAHELRTPVAAARNLVEAFRDGVLPPDETNLSQLDGELRRLGRLVSDLRDLSVAESGKLQLAKDRLELREVVDSAVGAWRERFSEAGLTFAAELPQEPFPVAGDAAALERVIGNLLANAHKYTPRGGEVKVSLSREGDRAVVTVEDTGVGIPPEELPLVFERFFRGEAARRAGADSTGVGLAIVRELVEAHRGEVSLTSQPGKGTIATVRLPLA